MKCSDPKALPGARVMVLNNRTRPESFESGIVVRASLNFQVHDLVGRWSYEVCLDRLSNYVKYMYRTVSDDGIRPIEGRQ